MVVIVSSLVNFAIVVFILWWFGRKPVMEFFRTRRHTIETSIADAETVYRDAEKSLNAWDAKWKQCEAQSKEMFADAKTSMSRFRERGIQSSLAESERILKESQLLGKGEVLKARQILQEEMVEKSIAMAEKYLEKQLEDRDKHKLISDYVEIVDHATAR